MAWIEAHDELRDHPKTKRLARELRIAPYAAIGLLFNLWWWATKYAPDGDITELDDWEIAEATGWEKKDQSKIKKALISAGFLDNTEQGTLLIHDWSEYAGKNLKNREQARIRTQRYRDKQKANATQTESERDGAKTEKSRRNKGNEAQTKQNGDGNVTHTQRTQNENETDTTRSGNASTVQDSTVHNITVNNITENNTPPIPPTGESVTDTPQEKQPSLQERRFAEFWQAYPKKKSKGQAERAWKKIKPDTETFDQIIAAIANNLENNPDWKKQSGQYIPYPATWLNAKGWLDEISTPKQETHQPEQGGSVFDEWRNAL